MKNFILLVLLVLAGFPACAQQDTVPNAGFEHWTINPTGYTEPNGWNTFNPITSGTGIYTCLRDSAIVHSGKYSVKLITRNIGEPTPGILTTGTISATGQALGRGIPIGSRPLSFSGWYQYVPGGVDTATAAITLYKAGVAIGTGSYYMTDTVTTWTPFTVPINYISNGTPDTVQLLFYSGLGTDESPINSSLWLDDLSYSYSTGICDAEILPLKIYPNPANQVITVENNNAQAQILSIYDLTGKLVNILVLHDGKNTLDVLRMNKGPYLLSATGKQGVNYRTLLLVE
jgi:hypothetical protein